MIAVDVIATRQIGNGVGADVVIVKAAEHVVQQSFAQRPVGNLHAPHAQRFHNGAEDREAAWENVGALPRREMQFVDVFAPQHFRLHLRQ